MPFTGRIQELEVSRGFCDTYVFSSLPAWDTGGHSGAQMSIMCLDLGFSLLGGKP